MTALLVGWHGFDAGPFTAARQRQSTFTTAAGPSGRLVRLDIGHDELVIRHRYESLSSVLFFFDSTTTYGTWRFLIGRIDLLIRPVIRLVRNLHVQRIGSGELSPTADF